MRVFLRGKTWYAEFYDRDGNRVVRTTRCRDHKAAVLVARRLEREAADPAPAASTETLVRALNEFLIVSERRMKDGEITRDTHDYNEGRVRPLFIAGETVGAEFETILPRHLGDLAPRHIDAYIAWRRSSNVKPNTIKKELVVLGVALRIAKRREWWFGDFEALMPEDFKPEYEPGKRWLTFEEVAAILISLPAHRAAHIAFSVATGARPEEAPRAQKKDIGATRVHIRGTKTDAAERYVPIVLWWQAALLERVGAGEGLAFPRWPMMRRDLRKKADALGIKRFSPRDLRRTFAHWMRQAGVPEDLVAKMLGHTSTKMVSRVYADLSGAEVEALVRSALGCSAGVRNGSDLSDSSDKFGAPKSAESADNQGSSCWTRTSDPVVNSRSLSADVSDTSNAPVAPVIGDELLGLSRAARSLSDLWDILDEAADEERDA